MQNSVHPDGDIQDVTAEDLSDSLQWHLHHTLAVSQSKETDGDWYLAFSVGLRDQLAERWMKTQDCYAGKKVRRAYYLSLEFLIGRLLGNNAMNMGLYDKCREALADGKLSWEDMQEMERDPGLGNGGLGKHDKRAFKVKVGQGIGVQERNLLGLERPSHVECGTRGADALQNGVVCPDAIVLADHRPVDSVLDQVLRDLAHVSHYSHAA